MLEQIAKKINLEMSNNSLKIGNIVKHPEGYLIKIMGGCYLNPDNNRVSNYWYWQRVHEGGSLGIHESGYGW